MRQTEYTIKMCFIFIHLCGYTMQWLCNCVLFECAIYVYKRIGNRIQKDMMKNDWMTTEEKQRQDLIEIEILIWQFIFFFD